MPKPSKVEDSYDDIEFVTNSAYGVSKMDKSDTSIEWEQGDDSSNMNNQSLLNDSESNIGASASDSMFDEESKITCTKNEDLNSESDYSDSYSSDSLDSVFDYTTCFDLLERNKEFVTVNLKIQMEICTGPTLKEFLEKRFDNDEMIDRKVNFNFFRQIIEGIKEVHKQGIIHRDLKPANVFITGEGVIKIGDFGLARAIDKNDTKNLSSVAKTFNHFTSRKFLNNNN